MSITSGKRITKEVDGRNLAVVEENISNARALFLKEILEFNKQEVIIKEYVEDNSEKTYTIFVTDLLFNPTLKLYERALKQPNGETVSVEFWNQKEEIDHLPYFEYREKNPDAVNMDDFFANPWANQDMG
jgi:hypothetical protein